MRLDDVRKLKEDLLKQVREEFGDVKKEAMSHQIGGTNISSRDLKWKRFAAGSPLPVPQMMRDEVERLIVEFRMTFAPYSKSPAAKKVHASFKDMVFAWYTADASVTPDDIKQLNKEEVDPQTKAKLKWVAEFIQNTGIQLLQPGTNPDPKSSAFGNLNDRHLSHYGYAYKKFVPVQQGKPSVAMGSDMFDVPGAQNAWQAALSEQRRVPQYYGRVFEVKAAKTSTGSFGLFAHFRTPDGMHDKVMPITALAGNFDINNSSSYKGLPKFFINYITPGKSFFYAPNGPHGQIKLVAGKKFLLDNLKRDNLGHHLEQYKDEGADMYQHNDTNRYRLLAHMNKLQQHQPHLYQLQFENEEGGLIGYNPYTGESFPLSQAQVQALVNPGEVPGAYRNDGRPPLYLLNPAKQPLDGDGNPKPPGYGPWDIKEADRELLRKELKPYMDMLGGLTMKYRASRANREDYRPHTPAQQYKWVVVAPRFQIPDVLPTGKAQGIIFNRKFMVDSPAGAPAAPVAQPEVAMASSEAMKKEAIVKQPGEGTRNWVIITHDVNVEKQRRVGGKRFPYEAMNGNEIAEFPTAVNAVQTLASKYAIASPDMKKVQAADAVLQAAIQEIAQMGIQPDMNTPEMQQERQELERQDQLSQSATTDAPMGKHIQQVTHEDAQLSLFDQMGAEEPEQANTNPWGQDVAAPVQPPVAPIQAPKKKRKPVAPAAPVAQPNLFDAAPPQPQAPGALAPTASNIAANIMKKYGL